MSLEHDPRYAVNLNELYKQVLMDHFARPRNKGRLDEADFTVHLENPTCGDTIEVQLKVRDGRVEDVRWQGHGCSISMASASMTTQAIKGKTLAEAAQFLSRCRAMIKGEPGDYKELGELQALSGVAKFPVRVKCATLAWNAVEEGLKRVQP
ncbi:MAG: SUF system NifU family Fe-S cluster assembly protein [Bacillota bacterium]|nr:MAG: SUF system NifU family Fe-S cluster assembly protein [Bacillota bacterium]